MDVDEADSKNSNMFAVISHAKVRKIQETERVLPAWLTNPTRFSGNIAELSRDIDEFAEYIDANDLLPYIRDVLQIKKLFPVQQCLIPHLTFQLNLSMYRRPNDICVSSPTGSGKTLAFVIPIVNHYMKRSGRALRVLVLAPVRDLAIQLHKIFVQVCRHTHLKVGLAINEKNFQEVCRSLVDVKLGGKARVGRDAGPTGIETKVYSSAVDILVATPGSLVDLIQNCPGFSLKDLEILVIDEADKMMSMYQHDWINAVEKGVFVDKTNLNLDCACQDHVSTDGNTNRVCFSGINSCSLNFSAKSRPLQKLLFSATLSSDPQQLLHVNLFQPRLFVASIETRPTTTDRARKIFARGAEQLELTAVTTKNELLTSSTIPDQLEEKMLRITEPPERNDRLSRQKAFAIWYFLYELKYRKMICFVNLQTTCTKLVRFLNQIPSVKAVECSSLQKGNKREKYLRRFTEGKIDVIVSTDLMSRGIDLEDVEYIVSFDMPKDAKDYVHRIGRTARAGKRGTAITLVQTNQVLAFIKVVQYSHGLPNTMKLSDIVQEIEIPPAFTRNPEKQDAFKKSWDDHHDEEKRHRKHA